MTDNDDTGLEALYRSAARETPHAAMDDAVMRGASAHLRRRRAAPFVALAAALLVAVLVAQGWSRPLPGAAPDATRAYLLQLKTPQTAHGQDSATEIDGFAGGLQ
jgi:hypothetical protein